MNFKERNERYKQRFIRLTESATGKAEVTDAIRKIGSELQKMSNKLADFKTKDISKIVNKVKLEFGATEAENLQSKAFNALDELISKTIEYSNMFFDNSYIMSGDLSNGNINVDVDSADEELDVNVNETEPDEENSDDTTSEDEEELDIEDLDLDSDSTRERK